MITVRQALAPSLAVLALLGLTSCSAAAVEETAVDPPAEAAESESPTASATSTPLTIEAITEWAGNAEWSFAPDGVHLPHTITLTDGAAVDDSGRTYAMGEAVAGDVNDDGVIDAAIAITETEGDRSTELWYLWVAASDATAQEPRVQQLVYPIARDAPCSDSVHSVTAIEGGFRLEQSIWRPTTDYQVPCDQDASGHQTRDITVIDLDGELFPMQVGPIEAWGGVCPHTADMSGFREPDLELIAAPHPGAPAVTDPTETNAVYSVPEAPLLAQAGYRVIAFMTADYLDMTSEEIRQQPIRVFCGFIP